MLPPRSLVSLKSYGWCGPYDALIVSVVPAGYDPIDLRRVAVRGDINK
jgi:hypothetical protein